VEERNLTVPLSRFGITWPVEWVIEFSGIALKALTTKRKRSEII
jgi:hypothetical protein